MDLKNNISLLEMLRSIEEETSTGTGASFSAGQGEQYATPNAFKRKNKIKEDLSYTTDKAKSLFEKHSKDLSNYESQAERFLNVVENFALGDLLEEGGEEKLDKIGDGIEAVSNKVSNIYDDLIRIGDDMEEQDESLHDSAADLSSQYHKLYMHLVAMKFFVHNVYMASVNMKEDDYENLTKYKK
jgi:hypothetical protein